MSTHPNLAGLRPPSPTDQRSSWQPSSRFKEHLSIDVPHPNRFSVREESRFSPVSLSPSTPRRRTSSSDAHSHRPSLYSFGSSTMFSPKSKNKDLEMADVPRQSSPRPLNFRDRFTRIFFDARSVRGEDQSEHDCDIPMQVPMQQWPPLNIEKRNPQPTQMQTVRCSCPHHNQKKETFLQKWRRRLLIFIVLILLLWLAGNVVALNVQVSLLSNSASSVSSASPSSTSSNSSSLSADVEECINQYTINAPNDPTTYPCSTCLPLLSALPSDTISAYPTALEATQFCALRAIWEDADSTGQSGLETGGWAENVQYCAWSGVSCDSSSRVISLKLTTPAIPASIPSEFGNLTALSSLSITGDGTIPGGSIPNAFSSLSLLTSLTLESTALTALPDNTLSSANLSTLILVKNTKMGSSLPTSFNDMPLSQLIVNNETLILTSAQQSSICSRTFSTCDLRGTNVTSCGSCLVD